MDGKFYFPKTNDFEKPEVEWDVQGVAFDDIDGRPVLSAEITHHTEENIDNQHGDYIHLDEIGELETSDSYKALPADVRALFARLLIDPVATPIFAETSVGGDNDLYVRNYGERLPVRGGSWGAGAHAGVAALYLAVRRSFVYSGIGCRPAFINLKD